MEGRRLRRIVGTLRRRYELKENRRRPFRVLMHVILAARTTDLVSWPAADRLIKIGKDARGISKMSIGNIEKTILPSNFYRNKARYVKAACRMLVDEFGGRVPRTREELMRLPGVGGKSADIVMSFCYDKPVIAVDAHVKWVSSVLDISHEKDPEKVRARLHEIFPERERSKVNDLFVQFGKEICNTGRPKCWMCPVSKMCPYGKKRMRAPQKTN